MALSTSKLVLGAVGRAVYNGRHFSVFKSSSKFILKSPQEWQASRLTSRSMWNLCSGSRRNSTGNLGDGPAGPLANGTRTTRVTWPSKSCSCGCGGACLHTEADSELANFLKEEIDVEQSSLTKIPNVPGFTTNVDGADVTLTGEVAGERIIVKFSVNHSVEMEGGEVAESGQDQETAPEMRSYPDFTVEISKGSSNNLRISCAFQRDEVLDDQEVDAAAEDDDLFLIDEILFAKDGASPVALDAAYRVGSEVMNGELYDHFKNYLAVRGINNDFCEKLSDVASAVEHRQYISFLEELQTFIKE